MVDAAGIGEPLHELCRKARRIDEQVACRTLDEIRVRAEGRARIEPATPHVLSDWLWKDGTTRAWLLRFAPHRCSRTYERRTPRGKLLVGRRRLAREGALVVLLDDETRRHMTRSATVDARRVDVPVARRRVGIAQRFHRFVEARAGRRTTLTFAVPPPPQKSRSAPSDASPDTSTPCCISSVSSTSPVRASTRRRSLSSPSHVACHSSPSTHVTPVTKRLGSRVRRMAPVSGSI